MGTNKLYLDDVHAWSIEQAALLRSLARSGVAMPNALDLENVVEEIEAVGNEQRHAVESNLLRAFEHFLKVLTQPEAGSTQHWLTEIAAFLLNARRRYRPSMGQLIDIDMIWRDAMRLSAQQARIRGAPMPTLPHLCPFDIAELLNEETDPRDLAARLDAATQSAG